VKNGFYMKTLKKIVGWPWSIIDINRKTECKKVSVQR